MGTALESQGILLSEEHEKKDEIATVDNNAQGKATARLRKESAKLLSMQLTEVDIIENLAAFGLDNMMLKEFRIWLFQDIKTKRNWCCVLSIYEHSRIDMTKILDVSIRIHVY